jgi:hypothetical protein
LLCVARDSAVEYWDLTSKKKGEDIREQNPLFPRRQIGTFSTIYLRILVLIAQVFQVESFAILPRRRRTILENDADATLVRFGTAEEGL